jgi:hypothetical protein
MVRISGLTRFSARTYLLGKCNHDDHDVYWEW